MVDKGKVSVSDYIVLNTVPAENKIEVKQTSKSGGGFSQVIQFEGEKKESFTGTINSNNVEFNNSNSIGDKNANAL